MNKFGLVGEKLGHTFSPMIHKHIFKHLNIKAAYDILEYEKSKVDFIADDLKAKGYKGLNVTIPYKSDLMKYIDVISKEAKRIGAINTIKLKYNNTYIEAQRSHCNSCDLSNMYLEGYNTDYYGFKMMLEHNNIEVKEKNALILGTGGVSGAVYYALIDNGVNNISFATSHIDTAKQKYPDAEIIKYDDIHYNKGADLLINCTPIGMKGFSSKCIIEENEIIRYNTVIDLIYNPLRTQLLQAADKRCEKSINGLYMLVAQAVKSEEIWNDTKINKKIIDEIMALVSDELKGDRFE